MRCFICSLMIGLLLVFPIRAEPPSLTLPEKVQGKVGSFITIAAQTPGKNVSWLVIDPGLNLFPSELLRDTKTAIVVAAQPGTYRILAAAALGDEVSALVVCKVIVGDEQAPPSVVPVTQPVEPPPPATPATPIRADSFTENLQRAYFADPDGQKVKRVRDLIAHYRRLSSVVNDTSLRSTTDVLVLLQRSQAALMPNDALPFIRKAIGEELDKSLASTKPLDTAARNDLAKTFTRIADVLEKMK